MDERTSKMMMSAPSMRFEEIQAQHTTTTTTTNPSSIRQQQQQQPYTSTTTGPPHSQSLPLLNDSFNSLNQSATTFNGIRGSILSNRRNFSVAEVEFEMMAERGARLPTESVVQLHATGVGPSYTSPWRVGRQLTWTGSGFCVSGRRIVTNAHNVESAIVLQVVAQDHPKKWRARVTAIAHDLDLAVVEVDDEAFWSKCGVETVELASAEEVPALYSEVNAIGFSTGGSTICVTKGVISRIDAHLYVHPNLGGIVSGSRNSPGEVFIVQVDSAINPGNSGGPAVSAEGKVVGVASSGRPDAQNVGYIIPASIVHLFLNEVKKNGRWGGVSELGIVFRALESDAYRAFIGMSESDTGVLVTEVAPLGVLHDVVRPGDVITHVDGLICSNEGKVPISTSGQQVFVPISAMITSKPKGEATKLKIIRKNQPPKGADAGGGGNDTKTLSNDKKERIEVCVEFQPIPPLAPRFHGVDAKPEYVLIAGLVFSRVSVPLLLENLNLYREDETETWIDTNLSDAYKRDANHELVVLINVLKHDVNIGVPVESRVVDTIDGTKVKSLYHLAMIAYKLGGGDAAAAADDGEQEVKKDGNETRQYVEIKFKEASHSAGGEEKKESLDLPDIVLDRFAIVEANEQICEAHAIPHIISPSLLGDYGVPIVVDNDDDEENVMVMEDEEEEG